jgi:hypothetical protein
VRAHNDIYIRGGREYVPKNVNLQLIFFSINRNDPTWKRNGLNAINSLGLGDMENG